MAVPSQPLRVLGGPLFVATSRVNQAHHHAHWIACMLVLLCAPIGSTFLTHPHIPHLEPAPTPSHSSESLAKKRAMRVASQASKEA